MMKGQRCNHQINSTSPEKYMCKNNLVLLLLKYCSNKQFLIGNVYKKAKYKLSNSEKKRTRGIQFRGWF